VARPAPGADRSVAVLELLASHPDERFTLSEVARRCELNKATAHALLNALSDRGVLLRHPGEKRYSLGPRLVAIGDAARRGYTALDFVGPVLDGLVARTGLWARAWRRVDDHAVEAADAGRPDRPGGLARPVRLPLAPPLGVLFVAWSDAPSVEAWLARAASGDAVRPALDVLPVVRRRGFAVTLASPEWRALSNPRPAGEPAPAPNEERRLLLAVARQPLLLGEVDPAATYRPAEVAAPVFSSTGEVELVLSLAGTADEDVTGARVLALGAEVAEAATGLTDSVRGQRPAAT
jgi:DNA-binding IclR family transcriptional regulator